MILKIGPHNLAGSCKAEIRFQKINLGDAGFFQAVKDSLFPRPSDRFIVFTDAQQTDGTMPCCSDLPADVIACRLVIERDGHRSGHFLSQYDDRQPQLMNDPLMLRGDLRG